jgi:hypothetical protein
MDPQTRAIDQGYALPYFSTALLIPGKPSARSCGVIAGRTVRLALNARNPWFGYRGQLARFLHIKKDVGGPLTAVLREVGGFRLQVGQYLLDLSPESPASSCSISHFHPGMVAFKSMRMHCPSWAQGVYAEVHYFVGCFLKNQLTPY